MHLLNDNISMPREHKMLFNLTKILTKVSHFDYPRRFFYTFDGLYIIGLYTFLFILFLKDMSIYLPSSSNNTYIFCFDSALNNDFRKIVKMTY